MRPLVAAVIVVAATATAAADPAAAPGYVVETISVDGAMLSGLARDADDLLVTDLASGRLLRRGSDGVLVAFGPAFPHGPDIIGDPTGPYRVVRVGDDLIVAQGWTPVDTDPGPLDHALVILGEDGEAHVVSDAFWNPFDFVVDGETIYMVDAAANAIERLRIDGSGQETVFTFGRLAGEAGEMQALSPTEFAETDAYEVDAVPTGIVLGDGRLYVALFGGFPFLEGAGRVVSIPVESDAPPGLRGEIDGLNAPVALALDAGGRLLVLEHGLYDQATGFVEGSGRLSSFDVATGERRVILDGLTRPASVLVWDDGELVLSDLGGHLHFLTETAE